MAQSSQTNLNAVPVFGDRRTRPNVMTLVFMAGTAALSMNIFLPSMPGIAAAFDVDYALIQLAVSAYLALTGLLNLLLGPLADRYGRRIVLLSGFAVFVAASIGCVLAPNETVFLTCRMIQAVVASGMVLSRTIVRDIYPRDQAASMIGYVTMGMAVVPMIGPMVGGILDEIFGWRASFVLLAVFGGLVWVLIYFDLGETNPAQGTTLRQQLREYPALLGSRRFWGYALTAAIASGAFFAFMGGAPYVASEVLEMGQSQTGMHFGIVALGYICGNWLSGRLTSARGIFAMMQAGTLVSVAGMVLALALLFVGAQSPLSLFGPMFFVGMGNGMTLPSANAGLLSVRPKIAGTASGLGGALMIGGGAALAATTGALLGPQTGAWPLVGMMLAASLASVASARYTIAIERQVAG